MLTTKSQYFRNVKSITHGRPSRLGCSNPSMYDILQWQTQNQQNHSKNHENQPHPNEKGKISNYDVHNEYRIKTQRDYVEGKQECSNEDGQKKNILIEEKPTKSYSVDFKSTKQTQLPEQMLEKQPIRKYKLAKMKEFNSHTRNLPNSSFVTYYGKPAFEIYARCSSQNEMKTHNVMPHKGQNHPQQQQSYYGALNHGKKINLQDHIPRKPILIRPNEEEQQEKQKNSQIVRLPIRKPDLLNHVRFQLPKKRQIRYPRFKKKTQRKKSTMSCHDGLKYMNIRPNLLTLLEEKKKKNKRITKKVTEVEPQKKECEKLCIGGEYGEKELRIAGKGLKRGQSAKDLIYSDWQQRF